MIFFLYLTFGEQKPFLLSGSSIFNIFGQRLWFKSKMVAIFKDREGHGNEGFPFCPRVSRLFCWKSGSGMRSGTGEGGRHALSARFLSQNITKLLSTWQPVMQNMRVVDSSINHQ